MEPTNQFPEPWEAAYHEVVTLNNAELVGERYSNGLSFFRVIEVDRSSPLTHVIARNLRIGIEFPIAASIVRSYLSSYGKARDMDGRGAQEAP